MDRQEERKRIEGERDLFEARDRRIQDRKRRVDVKTNVELRKRKRGRTRARRREKGEKRNAKSGNMKEGEKRGTALNECRQRGDEERQ